MVKSVAALILAEFVGTALLVAVGCSFVVLDFASGSPIVRTLPNPAIRRALTGFLFGSTGGLIALSPIGKISGAHINPVVTLAFWMQRKMSSKLALLYIGAQLLGGIAGAALLGLWGPWAQSTRFAATTPGPLGSAVAFFGESAATLCLIVSLFVFVGHPSLRRYTPGIFPVLYSILVLVEAPLSGTSTNPARSLGPILLAHIYAAWWVYAAGPVFGTLLGVVVLIWLLPALHAEVSVAKVYYFTHARHALLQTAERYLARRTRRSRP